MPRFIPLTVAAALLLVPAVARAETRAEPCYVVRPGDTPDCPGHPAAVAAAAAPVLAPDHRDLRERTHSLLFPTGGTLAASGWQISNYDIVWTRLAIGVNDRVELSASYLMPNVAIPGVRVRLTPRDSAFVATVGSSYWATSRNRSNDVEIEDDRLQLGGTVAYQNRKFNIHGTLTGSPSLGERDSHLVMASVGGLVFVTGNLALGGELMGISSDNHEDDQFDGSVIGAKLLGHNIDIDVGLMFFPYEVVEVPLPVAGLTLRN